MYFTNLSFKIGRVTLTLPLNFPAIMIILWTTLQTIPLTSVRITGT